VIPAGANVAAHGWLYPSFNALTQVPELLNVKL
jgi:hypothetical protein